LTQAPELPRPPAPSYETKGRRDPFEVLETREGAGGTSVSSAKLAGIVRSAEGPLALIETPDGLGYILRPGDTLGDGRLVDVRPDSVVFSVPTKRGDSTNRVVLKLPGDS
jgi:Tfp pilus assembly protein PilP